MKSYFEHLSNKNISLKITIEKILRILLRIYKIKKTKEIFPLSFYFCNAKRTHWNQWLSVFGKKLVFLAVVGFCYQCFENPFGYLLIRFFGVLKIFPIQLAKLDSQEVTQVWNTAQFAQNHAVFCDLWLCEGFYSVWSILGCLNRFYGNFGLFGLLLLKLEWKPCDCPPFFVLFVARCNIGMLINLL